MKRIFFLVLSAVFLVASCAAKKDLVVLLPDPDGQVGKIAVSNRGGEQVLARAFQATEITARDVAPSQPAFMKEEEVKNIFRDALSAQPDLPIRVILYFRAGTTELTGESLRQLPQLFAATLARKAKEVAIVGHTDRVGPREANYKLGLDRAQAIRAHLVTLGIDPALISVDSHGEDNPLYKTEDEVAEPRNRRIEVTIR